MTKSSGLILLALLALAATPGLAQADTHTISLGSYAYTVLFPGATDIHDRPLGWISVRACQPQRQAIVLNVSGEIFEAQAGDSTWLPAIADGKTTIVFLQKFTFNNKGCSVEFNVTEQDQQNPQ